MSLFKTVLTELAGAFETAKRKGGKESFVRIKRKAPKWLLGSDVMLAIHAALDGRGPDDWTYATTAMLAKALTAYDVYDAADAREYSHEICDGAVDIWNDARYEWLGAHLGNAELCDEARSEMGSSSEATMADIVGAGQYLALTRIYEAMINAIEEESSTR